MTSSYGPHPSLLYPEATLCPSLPPLPCSCFLLPCPLSLIPCPLSLWDKEVSFVLRTQSWYGLCHFWSFDVKCKASLDHAAKTLSEKEKQTLRYPHGCICWMTQRDHFYLYSLLLFTLQLFICLCVGAGCTCHGMPVEPVTVRGQHAGLLLSFHLMVPRTDLRSQARSQIECLRLLN